MKKIMIVLAGVVLMAACNPSNNKPGESGTVDDGIKPVDQNGAFSDTTKNFNPSVDTAIGDDRVGTEKRDTSHYSTQRHH
jgi:hypothetical protein